VEKATGLAAELLRSAPSAAARRRADGMAPLHVLSYPSPIALALILTLPLTQP
jgi:hypothetical protein